ncbi:hypothetical protein [Neolewinella lacunae]|uniref:hypothetical protein n=1 Tax=Neolewinella lacunae TaxID=1517758 RepID=UPI001CA43914|nr:hypothetical protein [Neolewinella lacunae]
MKPRLQDISRLGSKEGCQVELEEQDPQGPIGTEFAVDPGKIFNHRGEKHQDGLNLSCTHTIHTMDGRVLGNLTAALILDETGAKGINHSLISGWLNRNNLPAGIYLVSSLDQQGRLLLPTQKVLVTK